MGLPIAPWFKKDRGLSELLNDNLFNGVPRITQYVRPEFINKLKTAFQEDTTPYYGDSLWVFLILELWLREARSLGRESQETRVHPFQRKLSGLEI